MATGIARLTGPEPAVFDRAEVLAAAVLARACRSSTGRSPARADNWRLDRIGAVERNILRLGIHELREGDDPAQGGDRRGGAAGPLVRRATAPAFINGVLDRVARADGRL